MENDISRMTPKRECQKTCFDLALEGERLCKMGECHKGVQFFEMAIQVGTTDMQTLSAIYSQMGNAYFYTQDYSKALQFHMHDLKLARLLGDEIGEAKACGNLGNTLKIMGRFDDAVDCCKEHLNKSQQIKDKIGEARALYNLGNIYLSKAKHIGCHNQFVEATLQQAVELYKDNLKIVCELGDRAAVGRTSGNLGNTYYLLRDFENAIRYHQQRLAIAKEFGDKAAERRAYCNLGNSYVFSEQFDRAADEYKKALEIAKQLGDESVEAQVCYSLGNVYTLLKVYDKVIDYHLRHLQIAKQLNDMVGLGRAYWSLGNAYTEIGDVNKALIYVRLHIQVSTKICDASGQSIAQQKLKDLRKKISSDDSDSVFITGSSVEDDEDEFEKTLDHDHVDAGVTRRYRSQKYYKPTTPTTVQNNNNTSLIKQPLPAAETKTENENDDSFMDMLSCFQGRRLDDQRCSYRLIRTDSSEKGFSALYTPCLVQNELSVSTMPNSLDPNASRKSEQTHDLTQPHANLPGLERNQEVVGSNNCSEISSRDSSSAVTVNSPIDERFLDLIVRSQNNRYDDQRSSLPSSTLPVSCTIPDEDFFSLIHRLQSSRIDNQRSAMPQIKSSPSPSSVSSASANNRSSSSKKKKSEKKSKLTLSPQKTDV